MRRRLPPTAKVRHHGVGESRRAGGVNLLAYADDLFLLAKSEKARERESFSKYRGWFAPCAKWALGFRDDEFCLVSNSPGGRECIGGRPLAPQASLGFCEPCCAGTMRSPAPVCGRLDKVVGGQTPVN